MPNYYATSAELTSNIASYQVSNDASKSAQLSKLSQMTSNSQDNQLLMKMTTGDISLTPQEKDRLWTISNPSQLQEMLSSKREKMMGGTICSKKKTTDDWNRPADINSVLYYTCPGDDPIISIDRENLVSRLAYDEDYVNPRGIPFGLQL
jgi:hypothetical protein